MEEHIYFHYAPRSQSITERSWDRNVDRKHGEILLAGLLTDSGLADFLTQSRTKQFFPEWPGPSYISSDNSSPTCLQSNLKKTIIQLRLLVRWFYMLSSWQLSITSTISIKNAFKIVYVWHIIYVMLDINNINVYVPIRQSLIFTD